MARVKGCGTCFRPLAECECEPDDDPQSPAADDGSDGGEAA